MEYLVTLNRKFFSSIVSLWLALAVATLFLNFIGLDAVKVVNIIGTINLSGALMLIWLFTNRGQSFLFLFSSIFSLFLGGRLFSSIFGYQFYPDYVSFGGGVYVGIDAHLIYVALLLVAVNSLLLGASVSTRKSEKIVNKFSQSRNFLKFLNICMLITLPFFLYKNFLYFKILGAQGGYIAMYLSSEHIQEAGLFVRLGALSGQTILLARVFFAKERADFLLWMMLVGLIFSVELMIGLRGKYFIIMLALFFVYIIRYNIKLNLKSLIAIACVISLVSVAIEKFREQKSESTAEGFLLLGFLHQQGVTGDVVKGVIAFSDQLGSGIGYLLGQVFNPFVHTTAVEVGWFLSDDLSQLIMPDAYRNGFGTGSSYIAELYLIGGACLISIVNFMLAFTLKSVYLRPSIRDFYKFIFIIGLLYYPRGSVYDPINSILKYGVVFTVFLLIYIALMRISTRENINQ